MLSHRPHNGNPSILFHDFRQRRAAARIAQALERRRGRKARRRLREKLARILRLDAETEAVA